MPATASPRWAAERLLHATLSPDPGEIADCYAPGVVIEMPFAAAALYPSRIETTREELRAQFRAGAAVRRYQRLSDVFIHDTADPEVVITEYQLHGELIAMRNSRDPHGPAILFTRDSVEQLLDSARCGET